MEGKKHDRVVLAYSGGLDTTVAIPWLREELGAGVVAVCIDVGQEEDLEGHAARARRAGAEAVVLDATDEFAGDMILPALKANLLYQGVYPLGTALARPVICRRIVELARETGATALAHGCTAKGNDQVRFEAAFACLAPDLPVVAPMRRWAPTRQEEIGYARDRGLEVPVKGSPYSVDENLWGRSVECGPLEDPWARPPEDAFGWTVAPAEAPDRPDEVVLSFEAGVPVALDGEALSPAALVRRLNGLAGAHGIGRIDHVEDRLVGIKSREVYEYPAATVLIAAHRALESLVLTGEVGSFKPAVEQRLAGLVYGGLWFSPLARALKAFVETTQEPVTGHVRVELLRGRATVTGVRSDKALYRPELSTYGPGDDFDHSAARGFLQIYSLPHRLSASVHGAPAAEEVSPPSPEATGGPSPSPAGHGRSTGISTGDGP